MSSIALLKAVTSGRSRQVRLLLDSGSCNVDFADECGQTPLIRAIFIDMESSRDTIIRILLKHGATVGKTDVVGRDALAWACLYGRDANVEQLLDHTEGELDLNRPDVNGQTPLFHAVTSGNASTVKSMVEALLKYGLSVDVQDFFGTSPLMLAMRLNHDVCASILIRNGKAKVGLGVKYPNDFNRAEKWAVQTMRNRQKTNRSNFSPRVYPSERPQMPRHGQRNSLVNGQVAKLQLPPNSDSESDLSESEDSEVLSIYTSGPETDDMFKYCMKFAPKISIPPSILAVSPSSSTVANASSSDEVDTYSTPYSDPKLDQNKNCLGQLYGLVQDQMATSYRPTAKPLSSSPSPSLNQLESERSEVSNRSTRGVRKGTDKMQRSNNMTLKHQTIGMSFEVTPRGTPLSDSRNFPSPIQRGTTFPLLSDRRTDLVNCRDKNMERNFRTGHNNYSLM
ncbi:uncharacterized protein LOC132557847 [Ylistrum balloti]|uniref:uncharacterized protein LOC132557847 n=1 Tax=Ylistrum balloti TaxID=509963 RepID=UPI002905E692|nr:uncharacterized protein LOC132557847 [Ylistrum balloti]